jgi:hypothetical protein
LPEICQDSAGVSSVLISPLRACEVHGRADEPDVAERLWEIAEKLSAERIDLLSDAQGELAFS